MLRIQRTPVQQNRKCESCLHYDGNAQAKSGACEVGTQPFMCGDGSAPRFGYAPLADMAPDVMDDLAAPTLTGQVGAMNEHGALDRKVQMQMHVLGDEQLTIAQRIRGDATSMHKGFVAPVQGQVGLSCPDDVNVFPHETTPATTFDIAKTLYSAHMRPSLQQRYSLKEVMYWLGENGFDVTDVDASHADEYDAANREILRRQFANQERDRGAGA